MTEKLLMYGVGRETKYYDMPAVRAVMRDAAQNRYRFSDLVLGIVKSAPFQMRVKSVRQQLFERVAMAAPAQWPESESRHVMFITKKHLPRRTFLRGMGVTLALPLLDSMIPARHGAGADGGAPQEPLLRHLRPARRHDGQVDAGDGGQRASRSPETLEAAREAARPRHRRQQPGASDWPAARARTPAPITRVRPRSS